MDGLIARLKLMAFWKFRIRYRLMYELETTKSFVVLHLDLKYRERNKFPPGSLDTDKWNIAHKKHLLRVVPTNRKIENPWRKFSQTE